MKKDQNMGFGTKAIHAGNLKDTAFGSLTAPIYQTSTFVFDSCKQGGDRFAGGEKGFIYTRLGNPTTSQLEEKMAVLEGGEECVAFSSGMGAITSVIWTICKAGDHILADTTLYGCTHALLADGISRYGIEVTFADLSDINVLKSNLKKNTKIVYCESPANPNLKIVDLKEIAETAHSYNKEIMTVCDNTFSSPYIQRPIELGFDVVVHSATKYLNGHGDVIAGLAVGTAEFMNNVRFFGLKDMTGAVLGPFDAFLILRGLKTLELRMQRHCANAGEVVKYLEGQSKVEKLYYPGLENHPRHDIAKKQMNDFGGMVSFVVKGGRAAGEKLLDNLKLISLAVSLGDAETLIEHPASMTHSVYSAEGLKEADIDEGLCRMSVGLENFEDIIADLDQAFAKL